MDFNKIVLEVLNEKAGGEEFKKIISEQIDKTVKDILTSAFSSYGRDTGIYKALQEKLEPLFKDAVDKCDLSSALPVIIQALNNEFDKRQISKLSNYCSSSMDKLLGKRMPEIPKKSITLAEIFQKYTDFISVSAEDYDDYDDDFQERDDDGKLYNNYEITSRLYVIEKEEEERKFYGKVNNKKIDFALISNCEDSGEIDDQLLCIRFSLVDSFWDDGSYFIDLGFHDASVKDISKMPDFIYWLWCLSTNNIKIIADKKSYSDDYTVTVFKEE